MTHTHQSSQFPHNIRAMTLVEVVVAIFVMVMLTLGLLAVMMQSRRLTEGSIYQQTATTIAEGYLEQMRNMDLASLCNYDANGNAQLTASYTIPTLYPQPDASAEAISGPIATTIGTPPSPTSVTPGTTPSGVVDNLKSFDMTKGYGATNVSSADTTNSSGGVTVNAVTATSTWQALWPGANNYPTASTGTSSSTSTNPTPTTTTPGVNDLHMDLWVWVTDLSGTSATATKVYGITLFYSWQYRDGNRVRYAMNSLRTIRSNVPTY